MDLLKMTEARRLAWLKANRITLIIVGVVWIGMIGWYWAKYGPPWFLIACVPVFALFRLCAYLLYKKRLPTEEQRESGN